MARVLVTGAPGWLGTRLLQYFSSFSADVRCLVQPGVDDSELRQITDDIVYGDVRSIASLKDATRGIKLVYHLAGVIHPKRTDDFFSINTQGTENVISAAVRAGAARFIYVSSNSPAGHNTNWGRPMTEGDIPKPYKGYGLSKYLAEQIVNHYHSKRIIETVIIRPCWCYGERQPARQTRLFRMIKSGKPIIFGSGQNLRSLSYIGNVIQALVLAGQSVQADGQTYWIADEQPYSTLQIYQTIAHLLGVQVKPRFVPKFLSDGFELADTILQKVGRYSPEIHVAGEMAKDIYCSIDKAKRELGYNPQVSLEEGMRRSIEWCRENGVDI